MSPADLKCPICSKVLEESEYGQAKRQLEKNISKKNDEQLKKGRKAQHNQIQVLRKKHKAEKKTLQKRFTEQARRNKAGKKRELAQLKRNYQMQLEQMREFYGSQNAVLQNELKTFHASQLEGMKKNYEGLAAGNQRQLETLQKYLEDKVVGELREKVSELEEAKMSAELKLAEMVQQLDERNAEMVSLKDRLSKMDYEEPGEQEQIPIQEQGGNQQELLRIVKEVAQQKEMDELGELEDPEEGKQSFWGKSKRFGLF